MHVVCADPDSALAVQSLFEVVTRSMLSNAPLHGGRIALHILSDPARKAAWCVGVLLMLPPPLPPISLSSCLYLSCERPSCVIVRWHRLTNRKEELRGVCGRILTIRRKLQDAIVVGGCLYPRCLGHLLRAIAHMFMYGCACICAQAAGIPGDWSFVTKQIGMFCYTGLTGTPVLCSLWLPCLSFSYPIRASLCFVACRCAC